MNNFNINNEPKITSGFTIPDHYFETLLQKLQPKLIIAPHKIISFSDRIKQNKKSIISIAAIFIVSISVVFYQQYQIQSDKKYTAELENYITNRLNYSDDEIVNLLTDDEIAAIKIESKLNTETIENQLLDNQNFEQIITN